MPHRDAQTIDSLLDSNARALFENYGAKLSEATEAPVATTLAAVIGYSGREIGGSLCITTVREVTDKTYGNEAPPDWLGELANQLLGRLKTDLARRGAEVFLTTPLVLKGYRLEVCASEDEVHTTLLDYVCEAGPVQVMLQYEFKEGCALTKTQHIEDSMDVSDVILF